MNLATLAQNLTTAGPEIRILPPGVFRSIDGRPAGLTGWKIDAAIAARIVADLASRDDLVIDYEHQTLLTKQNGQPAPAAGWFRRVLWREGQGLFAADVKWTDKARRMIAAREYRYISPVFSYSSDTGQVERLLALGLTNNPALSGLTDLAHVAANVQWPATAPRDSDRSIELFNRVFGVSGVFHPQTPGETLARLSGTMEKPTLPASLNDEDAESLRLNFPAIYG